MQKGFQLAPSAPSGRVLDYGRALQQLSRLDEASAAYKAVVAQSPDDADALFHLGSVEDARGDKAAALASYKAALEYDPPDEARVHNNIGAVYTSMGELEPALAALQEAVDVDPGLVDGWFNIGNAMLGLRRYAEADAHLEHALRLSPEHAKVSLKLEQVRAAAVRDQEPWDRERAEHQVEGGAASMLV